MHLLQVICPGDEESACSQERAKPPIMSAHTLEKATDFSASICDVLSKRGQCYNWEEGVVSAMSERSEK